MESSAVAACVGEDANRLPGCTLRGDDMGSCLGKGCVRGQVQDHPSGGHGVGDGRVVEPAFQGNECCGREDAGRVPVALRRQLELHRTGECSCFGDPCIRVDLLHTGVDALVRVAEQYPLCAWRDGLDEGPLCVACVLELVADHGPVAPLVVVPDRRYGVVWIVAMRRWKQTFRSASAADSFRAELLTAVRKGDLFDADTGRPRKLRGSAAGGTGWYEFACSYVDMKWPDASPKHRKSIAECLVTLTPVMLDVSMDLEKAKLLRSALLNWGYNTRRRGSERQPSEITDLLDWTARHSWPLA